MLPIRTVPRVVTPTDLRDWALQDAQQAADELATLLQVPGPHVTAETLKDAGKAWERIGTALDRLEDAQERVDGCERKTLPFSRETVQAAREAIEARRGMVNDIGPSSFEVSAWGELLP